jgi:DNA replication protein DnaC
MNHTDIDLDSFLKRLHLANTRRIWRDLIVRAETEQWSFHAFLAVLVSEEVAHRQQTRLGRLSRRAELPFLKTIDDFDFTFQSTLRLALLGSALAPDFVTEGRCLILHGKPGRGKTHLAVAIAYRAIQNGFDALFVTAAELIDELSAAFRKGQLGQTLTRYTHPHILVVDEVGYLTYGTDAANMLFHVVNDRHKRRRSMLFTTNKPLKAWGSVLHDEDLAHAIVDRILERGRILHLDGPSMRTRHLGLDDLITEGVSTQVGGISGIGRAEFPEPTRARRGGYLYAFMRAFAAVHRARHPSQRSASPRTTSSAHAAGPTVLLGRRRTRLCSRPDDPTATRPRPFPSRLHCKLS